MLVITDKGETVYAKVHDPVENYGAFYGRQKETKACKTAHSRRYIMKGILQ